LSTKVDVARNVRIPMRDGVELVADIFRPRTPDRVPTILTRTAYGKSGLMALMGQYKRLAAEGYAVVVQDKRGIHASAGDYSILRDDSAGEHQDGYDTVEWIANQEWSDGQVVAYGLSYLGHTTMGAAVAAPPHLTAAMSIQPSTDEYTDRTFVDGVLSLENIVSWATLPFVARALIAARRETERSELRRELATFRKTPDVYSTLPLESMPFMRKFPLLWPDVLAHREDRDFFAENQISGAEAACISVPIAHVGGWFDFFIRNTVRQYELVKNATGARQLLVVGPWRHGAFTAGKASGVAFPDSVVDTNQLLLEWVAAQTGRTSQDPGPAAIIYVLGDNRWRAEESWPIAGIQQMPYYLTADGGLAIEAATEGTRAFDYDPADPYRGKSAIAGLPTLDEAHAHPGLLVYRSQPLAEALEITGWPRAELTARTSSTDVDWVVELSVVDTNGVSRLLTEGITRARYRHGREHPQPVSPGTDENYSIDLRPISIILQPGERLEVSVTGGKFPTYERNPGKFIALNTFTADDLTVSHNEVVSGVNGSKVVLPIVPQGAGGRWIANPWPGTRAWRLTTAAITRAMLPS